MRLRIAWAALVGLAAVVAGTARLALLGWLLAHIFAGASFTSLVGPVLLVILVIAGRGALEHYRTMVAHATAARVQARLRALLYEQVTMLGPAHFTRARTGDVIVSMVEGIQQLETYFGQYLPQLCVALLTPVLIFAFVAFIDLPVALVMLVAALVTLFAPAAWHRRESARSQDRSQAYAAFSSEFLDSIQGLATLKAFGQSTARARLLRAKSTELFHTTMGVLRSSVMGRGITDAGIAMGAAGALALGVHRVKAGQMDLAALLVILMLGVEVFRPLRELRVLLHQGMLGLSAAKGIFAILGAQPLVRDGAAAVPVLAPTVSFEHVTFAYPESSASWPDGAAANGRAAAHRDLSFSLGAGARVAFVGPSGVGKSTIARLLLRFYDPTAGRVLVGGHDIRELPLDRLRALIAVVSQDTYLFHGTVEDNLRMGRPEATQAELDAAARAANAHTFIAELPQGYRTVVGERGVRLSGGQRQRIAIARALLRDAPILVLDEALSSVDAESEALIQEALDRLMRGRTTLIFAHRLSSVIGADRIFVLEGGRVVQEGTHVELMARGGLYHRLMSMQALAGDGGPRLEDGAGSPAGGVDVATRADDFRGDAAEATTAPTEGIVRAEGLTWPQLIRVLLGMIRGYRLRLTTTFVLGVVRVAALIGVGLVSALVVRAVKHGQGAGALLVLLAVMAPLAGVLHWLESWLAHDMAYRLLADMRLAMFTKLDALAPAYFTRRRAGDLVGVATHDVELIEYFFAHTITPAFVAILVPTAVLVTLGAFGWPMAAAVLPFLAWAGASPVLARRRIDELGSRAREVSGDLNAHAVDTVQGLAEIVAFQCTRSRGEEFAAKARAYFDARMPYLADLSRQTALQEIATGLGGLAVIVSGALLTTAGRLDPALLPLLVLLTMSAFVPVWEIAQVGRQLADTLGAARRVYAVHHEPEVVRDGPGIPATRATATSLEMSHVVLTYPGRRRAALADISFSVPRGSTIALVGPSGAGKTTVANVFLRFWDPDEGVVRLDGHDLRNYRLDELRHRIALVAQDTYLFNDSLRNNVLIARPAASDAEVAAAIDKASLTEFVAGLPEGLQTVVGERGTQLSGGQRQRVAIARAFLKDAPVLILDEATSHLDALNEAAVRASLDLLARGRTTLVIAHRLSTVHHADRIVVLDGGRLAQIGTHRGLLEEGGLYARLVSRQLAASAGATT